MFCRTCGAKISEEANFCSKCGVAQTKSEPQEPSNESYNGGNSSFKVKAQKKSEPHSNESHNSGKSSFKVKEEELVTPPLDGLILPGITRMSLLDLAREWNEFKVSEKRFTMSEFLKGLKENRIKEVFGAGTACVICPVKSILRDNQIIDIPTMENGPRIAKKFYDELTGIQYGRIPSPWSVVVTN